MLSLVSDISLVNAWTHYIWYEFNDIISKGGCYHLNLGDLHLKFDSPVSLLLTSTPLFQFDLSTQPSTLTFDFVVLTAWKQLHIQPWYMKKGDLGIIQGFKVTEGVEEITHFQFVDETTLMGEASMREAYKFTWGHLLGSKCRGKWIIFVFLHLDNVCLTYGKFFSIKFVKFKSCPSIASNKTTLVLPLQAHYEKIPTTITFHQTIFISRISSNN